MSHFTVAVISEKYDDVEKLLAPYQENNMGDCPQEYLAFKDMTEDIKEYYADRNDEYKDMTLEQYAEEDGYVCIEGKWGYYENPNAKWDWWVEGGRWNNLLKTKSGGKVNYCLIKDLDLTPNKKAYEYAIRFWEINVEGQELREDENKMDYFNLYKPEYYINLYGTKEKYAESKAKLNVYAMVLPDGKWYETGEMGWFACSSATKESTEQFENLFDKVLGDPLYQDYIITIIDCHI